MGWSPSYATIGELRAYRRTSDSLDDAQLGLALDTASRSIDQACNRQFGRADVPTARYYVARWDSRRLQWYAVIDDLMTQADMTVGYDSAGNQTFTSAITAYQLRPVNAFSDGWPWTELWISRSSTVQPAGYLLNPQYSLGANQLGDFDLKVVARWGWLGVPDAIRQACLLQASRLMSRQDSPYGIAGSVDQGSELRLMAKVDPDVAVALRPFCRTWGAV